MHRPGGRAHLRPAARRTARRTSSAPRPTSCSSRPNDRRRAPIPKLSEVLALARDAGARAEPRDQEPSRPTRTSTEPPAYANTVIDAIEAAGFPPSRLIVQSFWPPEPRRGQEPAPRRGDEPRSRSALEPGDVAPLAPPGYDWVSAQWPLAPAVHRQGARGSACAWCPYTIDTAAEIGRRRAGAGVDELITNDPLLARSAEAEVEPAAGGDPAAAQRGGLPRGPRGPDARHDRGIRVAPARLPRCSRCSRSRRPATWRPTRASAPRSSA